MRLLKIGVYPPQYLKQFYEARPELATEPYAAQHAELIKDGFGSSDFWTAALSKIGYETADLIANSEPLQKRWATEEGFAYDESRWIFDITVAQVKSFQPDALIVADYHTFDAAALRRLRLECPSIRLLLGWCGAPYQDASVFREWDIVLSCIPELVAQFRASGHTCYHVNHAFEPRILQRIETTKSPDVDFSFIGSVLKANLFHQEREKILLGLIEHTPLQIWSDIPQPSMQQRRSVIARQWAYDAVRAAEKAGVSQGILSSTPLVRRAARWESRPQLSQYVDSRISRRACPPLFGLAMFQKLHDSKVTLNTHIDISPLSASNMRLFEATGVGACLLTDWKENIAQLFEPDVEVLTYRHVDECIEKVRYILEHEEQRRAVAGAGQRRTLREHTFAQRATQIDAIIREALLKL